MINIYEVRGEVTAIFMLKSDRKTEFETLIDTDDLEKASVIKGAWVLSSHGYAQGIIAGKTTSLARWLLGEPKGMVVDHISGNTLDNRRCNLRIVTHSGNSQNRTRLGKDNTSGHRNVHWSKNNNKWMVTVTVNKKKKYIGMFKDIKQAAVVAAEARAKYLPNSEEARNAKQYG